MRRNVLASVVIALGLLLPAVPAAAQAGKPGLSEACQTIERQEYTDLRKLIDIDPDTAAHTQVRLRVDQILAAARAQSLPRLPDAAQTALDGSEADLRTFLKTGMQVVWSDDLLVLVTRTLTGSGTNVTTAAGKVLSAPSIEASLAYLNDGLYDARELDCQKPSATPSPVPPLPTTGTNTSFLAFGGITLVALGAGAVLLARRFRTGRPQ